MFSIEINGEKVEGEINFGTALDYELEFGRDMIADVNGSMKDGDSEFLTYDENGETLIGIDFNAVPWTTLLKVLWVAIKTRNPKTPPFKKWARETSGIDMFEARVTLSYEMESCFFRNAPVDEAVQE